MRVKTAEDYCEAVEGEFAWFTQLCMKTATGVHRDDTGDEFGVCDEHTSPSPEPTTGANE